MTYVALFFISFLWLLILLLKRCTGRWPSQPKIPHLKGCGNILIAAAAELIGIGYFEMGKFANILNFEFIKSPFTINTRGFYLSRNKQGFGKHPDEQFKKIQEPVRTLSLALNGQCDSPGHNTTYNTVTALDVETNTVLDFKVGLSGSDDLAVFKCFRVIFFLKNQTIQFSFSFNLYFQ